MEVRLVDSVFDLVNLKLLNFKAPFQPHFNYLQVKNFTHVIAVVVEILLILLTVAFASSTHQY